jgi:predicted dehydrogenase
MNPRPIELIGCGALAEQVYTPVLSHLEQAGRAKVVALVDPSAERRARLAKTFPSAQSAASLEDLPPAKDALAVIATPPGIHAAQTCALLRAGRHVLCEKPLAVTVAEAEAMVAAAEETGRLLAAGMMRRFYLPVQALRENLAAGTFGQPQHIDVVEGGRFGWNTASPKFFEAANGGVLFDLGSHVLDLLCHWFGAPAATESWNDALGGANTNCMLSARWTRGLTARVRLSWDTAQLPAGWQIRTERGLCQWNGSPDGAVAFQPVNGQWWLQATAQSTPRTTDPKTISSWTAAFVRQFENILGALEGKNPLLAPAADVLPSLRWLETASREAQLLPQPWLGSQEQTRATELFH